MHQRSQSIHAKSKALSTTSSLLNNRRERKPVRRRYSQGLPTFATDTVKMFVAPATIGNHMPSFHNTNLDESNEQDRDDDNDDVISNIGQQVQAHIPDFVLNNLNSLIGSDSDILIPNERKYSHTTLLFLDVSGFTSLTEQYSNAAHLGIDQLTRTLNSYFNKLVYEILTNDGDIYKFAGDAILALWTNESTGPRQALKCALHLQQKCGAYQTEVGVTLRLKVALAYGPVCAIFVGTDEFKHYLLTGSCVRDVNICEQLCEPGDIIITKAVYEKLQSMSINCTFELVSDDIDPEHKHIAVKYSESRKSFDENSDTDEHVNSTISVNDRMDDSNQDTINENNNNGHANDDSLIQNRLHENIDSLMKSFLLHCVHQRIERKQSLDYLSELRRVTISFINLNISKTQTSKDNLYENIHEIFIQIYESTKKMGGVLTKALLFDKGFSFLCVFGLPGYKQGDDTANALKSAQMIHSTIRDKFHFVDNCSIGVTTGLTYCGVVGHTARCEYTVIGRKVNMAARLMCNYPNIVSCDQETYYNSRLNDRYFQKLPIKILKGMSNVGIIWQYDDSLGLTQLVDQSKTTPIELNEIQPEYYPLLGRRVELMIVAAQIMVLDESINRSNRRKDLAAIIFEGEDKIGRSRLLQFIATSLENSTYANNNSNTLHYDDRRIPHDGIVNGNDKTSTVHDNGTGARLSYSSNANDSSTAKKSPIKVISYSCQFEQRFNEFGLLRVLLRKLLQFHDNDMNQYEREQYILRLLDVNKAVDAHLRRNLFLLNDLLDVRFRRTHIETENIKDNNLVQAYEVNLNELLLHILTKLIDQSSYSGEATSLVSTPNVGNKSSYLSSHMSHLSNATTAPKSKIIFIIDDIHFADESSLKHLLTLGSHRRCLLILSMKPPRNNHNDGSISNILQSISTDSRVYLRRLPGLELRYLTTLACQMLSVHKVPAKLVRLLNENCNGIPGFCEQIIFDLLNKDKIYIADDANGTNKYDQDSSLVEGDADKLLLKTPIKVGIFKTFFSRRKQLLTIEQRRNERAFARVCLLRNPTEDDINADCQQNFQNYIMCRIDRLSEGESLLVKIAAVVGNTFSRMFLCQLVDPNSRQLININSCILEMMQRTIVECAFSKLQVAKTRLIKCYCLQNPAGFPSQCRLMAFTHSTIREGIYNSLTDGLKRLLTRNAIDYLEKQCNIVCLTCSTSKSDIPFLVNEQDGLNKIIKISQQHAFADIVKMAALKEIDNVIKNLSTLQDIPTLKTISFQLPESNPMSNENETNVENHSLINDTDQRQSGPDHDHGTAAYRRKSSTHLYSRVTDEDNTEQQMNLNSPESLRRAGNDPTLTLISVYAPDVPSNIQFNVRRSSSISTVPSKPSQSFSLFKLPKRKSLSKSVSNTELLQKRDGSISRDNANQNKRTTEISSPRQKTKRTSWLSYVRCIFCNCLPISTSSSVTPILLNDRKTNERSRSNEPSSTPTHAQVEHHSKENLVPIKSNPASHWTTVRKAVFSLHGKGLRATPSDNELLKRTIFSSELMQQTIEDIKCLNKPIDLIRVFKTLYDQSLVFNIFQSYVQQNSLIQYVYELTQHEEPAPDLNQFITEFNSYDDLRLCECIDYVMTVYIKLVEYHTNLYDIYEKVTDDRRNYLRLKEFDRIMYYRIEICKLLLRCNCLQRLLVEIKNGRKLIEDFRDDTHDQEDFIYKYEYFIIKYTYDLFQAVALQRTKAIHDSKQLCEKSMNELNEAYKNKIWEKLISNTESVKETTTDEKREIYENSKFHQSKDSSAELSSMSQFSMQSDSDQFCLFDGRYRLEYLLCQYNLLKYELNRQEAADSIDILIRLQYYIFPISFSLPCTITLVEHFYYHMNYKQCLILINKIIQFWWSFVSPREKLEFAKLKCLSLIIELKQGSFETAILSGYFAKRILTGYQENVFLIQSCIHLTMALIGQMHISNIELILQHLEYLSDQTMNCYAKLWYYILNIEIAIELGYEILPITNNLLDNIAKYRKKLASGSNDRSLVLVYSDGALAQIYARLGLLDLSKIHFHQALLSIKFDKIHLPNTDFRLKRSLLKLVEVQLLHWYHQKDNESNATSNDFLISHLMKLEHTEFVSWNKSRMSIYQAYYDRLINCCRREQNLSIDNEFNWRLNLDEAAKDAIKLDSEWIRCLKKAWAHPVAEQIAPQASHSTSTEQYSGTNLLRKPSTKQNLRPLVPLLKGSTDTEPKSKADVIERSSTFDDYSKQKFINARSIANKNNVSQLQLYVLPVRI